MIRYSFKSLLKDRGKTILSIIGVALAIMLIIVMEGIFSGNEKQLAHYVENCGADVIVAQSGVNAMHLSSSFLPAGLKDVIQNIDNVEKVSGIAFSSHHVEHKGDFAITHTIGFDPDEGLGGPWKLKKGTDKIKRGEILFDSVLADKYGLDIGDKVEQYEKDFEIKGITEDSFSLIATLVFMHEKDLSEMLAPGTVSYFLVKVNDKGATKQVIADIKGKVDDVSVMSASRFAENEREAARDSGLEVLSIITAIGFLTSLAIISLTIYSATVERTRDYGILKAIGTGPARLFQVVLSQSVLSLIMGACLGIALSFIVSKIISMAAPELLIILTTDKITNKIIWVLLVGVISCLIPLVTIFHIEPLIAFTKEE